MDKELITRNILVFLALFAAFLVSYLVILKR
jgi:hypothetical protein